MTRLDPIIAVENVEASANWYRQVFGFNRQHGGNEFAVLVNEDGEIVLALHQWGAHDHPTMLKPATTAGNGLILYFRTTRIDSIRQNLRDMDAVVEQEMHVNPNSLKAEFSVRDPDGYYLSISQFHEYGGQP